MRAALLVALAVATPLLSGCLGSGGLGEWADDRWGELDVQPRFTESTLLTITQPFSFTNVIDPANPPQDPDDVGDRFETTFEVPNGTRTLQILFVVNFTTAPSPPEPLPQPELPSGDIRVFAQPPGDADQLNVTRDASGGGGFDVRGPEAGAWTVGFRARGEGQVSYLVTAVVPIVRGPSNATLAPSP